MNTTTTNNNNNADTEFNNDDFIYQSLTDQGWADEEACRILHNLKYYGSSSSPDEDDCVSAWRRIPINEDVMKLAMEMTKTRAANSTEESNI